MRFVREQTGNEDLAAARRCTTSIRQPRPLLVAAVGFCGARPGNFEPVLDAERMPGQRFPGVKPQLHQNLLRYRDDARRWCSATTSRTMRAS